jgi:hypothetical protein
MSFPPVEAIVNVLTRQMPVGVRFSMRQIAKRVKRARQSALAKASHAKQEGVEVLKEFQDTKFPHLKELAASVKTMRSKDVLEWVHAANREDWLAF